jgi:hypothetical protein
MNWAQGNLLHSLTLISKTAHWTVDEYEQLYQWENNTLYKQQLQGGPLFSESFKSISELTQVCPVNSLRIVIFSADQQLIGQLDNTLSLQGDWINLSELGFGNVERIAVSARPDYLWLYDSWRQRLVLFNCRTQINEQVVDYALGNEEDVHLVQFYESTMQLHVELSNGLHVLFDRNLTQLNTQTQAQTSLNSFQKCDLERNGRCYVQDNAKILVYGPK